MRIEIVSVWYNEEAFAPFFFTHYNYVDKIHIFLDADTTDNTVEICKQYANVEMNSIVYPGHMFDEGLVHKTINSFAPKIKSDWVYVLDPDEFIFPKNEESARAVLERQTANLLYAQMWQSWRHATEADLDPLNPSVYQRRYGTPYHKRRERHYNKPIIVRPEIGLRWKLGQHKYHFKENIRVSEEKFVGSHWKFADIDVAIQKRMERCDRFPNQRDVDREAMKIGMRKGAENHKGCSQMF